MLNINPKKFKTIKNKTMPKPLRPKFRNREQSNIYFLSKRKFQGEKKASMIKKIKFISSVVLIIIVGYLLSN